MDIDVHAASSVAFRAFAACLLACAWTAAEAATDAPPSNPAGGGASVVLEPVPEPPAARPRRTVFVCRDGTGVVFADRPCGQVVAARTLEVPDPGSGQGASTVPKSPSASVRPRPRRVSEDGARPGGQSGASPAERRCSRLRDQLEAVDDRMRAGYSAREAARLWNRWRELKQQLHEARCRGTGTSR